MINYLFSGIDKCKGFTEEQSKYLNEDIFPNSSITFVASVFDNYDKNDQLLLTYIEMFKKIGIFFKEVNLIDNRVNIIRSVEMINNSDIVFLLGGNPELQMKSILEYKLISCLKKCKILLGVSAGAMNLAVRVMYRDDFENFSMKDYNGIGVVNFNIFPHVDLVNISKEVYEISEYMSLILLPNDSFIRVKNGNVEIIGQSCMMYKGNID